MIFKEELLVFTLASLPISEARGAIPLGLIVFRMESLKVLALSLLGNILIVPLIYLALFVLNSRFPKISYLLEKLTKNKRKNFNFLNFFALSMFVAVPLPFTGAWSGTILAFLFKVPFFLTFFSVSLGVLISSLIVFSLTQAGIFISQNYGFQTLLGLVLFIILIFSFLKNR